MQSLPFWKLLSSCSNIFCALWFLNRNKFYVSFICTKKKKCAADNKYRLFRLAISNCLSSILFVFQQAYRCSIANQIMQCLNEVSSYLLYFYLNPIPFGNNSSFSFEIWIKIDCYLRIQMKINALGVNWLICSSFFSVYQSIIVAVNAKEHDTLYSC